MTLPCIFCEQVFGDCRMLAIHLINEHPSKVVQIGVKKKPFQVYKNDYRRLVRCICGLRVVVEQLIAAPYFEAWAREHVPLEHRFVRHLEIHGGIAQHLEDLRDKALLDKIVGV